LDNMPGIKKSVVVCSQDPEGENYLTAYYMVSDEKAMEIDENNLVNQLKASIPDYMVPGAFYRLEEFPLTTTGKIDRKALLESTGSQIRSLKEYVPPSEGIETTLANMWKELLKVEKVGVYDNFFVLGGNSLKAIMLTSKLHKELEVKLPLTEVFKTPTIRELAQYIKKASEDKFMPINTEEEREFYPLSPMQNRFFILNQLQSIKTSYNLPSVLTVEGKLEREKLEEAFLQLIRRHESLRTSFMLIGDQPMQRIHKEVNFKIEDHIPEGMRKQGELASLTIAEPDIKGIINNFVRPFDLSQAPLLRVELIKVEEEKHILMFDMHHIISDGTSKRILMKDILNLYEGMELPPLSLQYKDFSQWLYSLQGQETIAKQEAYWLDHLKGELSVLNMYTDYPRPPIQSFKGDTIHFFIGKELSQKIRQLIAQTGTTLYMVLLAVLNILLSRYSGQEDIVVGTPIAGRENADFEGVIALFINALPIRNYPRKDKTFSQFLTEVKKNTINAYENQGYPFETLMEKLKVEKDLSRNPLFDVELVVLNMETPALEAQGLTFTPYRHELEVSQVDMAFYVSEYEEEVRVNLMYCTDLFKRKTIEGCITFFQDILSTVVDNQEIKLEEIKMSHDLGAADSTFVLDDEENFGF